MKTPEELAESWHWENLTNQPTAIMLTNPPMYPADPRKAFLAGYQAAAPQWISVKDRLPEARKLVLYLHELHGHSVGWYDPEYPKPNYQWISSEWGDNNNSRITHWMALPEPPKEEV